MTFIPATETTPEIQFLDSEVEVSYQFERANKNLVGFVLTHYDHLRDYELHLALLKSDEDENFDVIEDIHLTYAEAKILRAYLNRPEVGRWLDKAE